MRNLHIVFSLTFLLAQLGCENQKMKDEISIKRDINQSNSISQEEKWCNKNYKPMSKAQFDLSVKCANYGYSEDVIRLSDYYFCEKKDIQKSEYWNEQGKKLTGQMTFRDLNTGETITGVTGTDSWNARTSMTHSELVKTIEKTKAGDRVAMAILLDYYFHRDTDGEHTKYWELTNAKFGDIRSQATVIGNYERNDSKSNAFKREWGWDVYDHINKSNLSKSDITFLTKKAQIGDVIAIYLLTEFYSYTDDTKSQHLFWLEKLANRGQVPYQNEFIATFVGEKHDYCNEKIVKLVKKWGLEFFYKDCFKKKYQECENR